MEAETEGSCARKRSDGPSSIDLSQVVSHFNSTISSGTHQSHRSCNPFKISSFSLAISLNSSTRSVASPFSRAE